MKILLSTLNAKYAHCSLGLRYLFANLGELRPVSQICEFVGTERTIDIAESILAKKPEILGLGIYIWNAQETLALVRMLKAVRPSMTIVLGGPEVSYETTNQEIVALADYVITGEGEISFADLASSILQKKEVPPGKIIKGTAPQLSTLVSPYPFYTSEDIATRSIYVEASRGCPFRCEFCLSSLDVAVRQFPLEKFLQDLKDLIDRGARHFKFIDRTFNLKPTTAAAILEFLLGWMHLGLFVHFEMVPDRLPGSLRTLIARFPRGAVQFEIGIQTFDPKTSERISRKQNLERLTDNLRFLREATQVHVHADLIMGLPGEDENSFARGFDRLVGLDPQEIQVGVLKRLRGTPIIRHDQEFQMVYETSAPYEILCNAQLSFAQLMRMKRFARAWDLVANSGNFRDTKKHLWSGTTPYVGFMRFTEWLFASIGHFSRISLDRLFALILEYLSESPYAVMSKAKAAKRLAADYLRNRPRLPGFLAEYAELDTAFRPPAKEKGPNTPKRQARHL